MKFRSKAIGGLALAVASITALAACSSSSSTSRRRQHDQREHHGHRRDWIGPGRGDAFGEGRDDHLCTSARGFPQLDLPAPELRQQHGLQCLRVPVGDVAAAVLAGERHRSRDRAQHEHRQPAGVLQRQQDRVDHDEEQLQVVGRQAHHRERLPLRHRPDQGRGQGVSGELGDLHTRPVPRHAGKHLGAERLDAGDEPQRPRQPVLVHRGRARRGTAAAPDAQLPVGEDVDQRCGHPPVRLDPGQHDEDLQLPDRAEQVAQHLRDQPAVAGSRRTVQAHVLQPDQRRVHHGAERQLRRPARNADVHLPGRPVHLERRAVQRHQGGQHRRRVRRLQRRAAAAQRAQKRLQLLRHPRLRHELRATTTSRTRPATSTTSSPSRTSARRSPTWWTTRAGSARS